MADLMENLNMRALGIGIVVAVIFSLLNSYLGAIVGGLLVGFLLKDTLLSSIVNGVAFANKLVHFYVNGVKIGTSVTNSNGIATYSYLTKFIGSKTLKATFEGDSSYVASTKSSKLSVTKAKTTLSITKFTGKYKKAGIIYSKLIDGAKKVIANKYVKFYMKGKYLGKAKTNSIGIATFKIKKVTYRGKIAILTKFVTDSYYLASSVTKKVTIK